VSERGSRRDVVDYLISNSAGINGQHGNLYHIDLIQYCRIAAIFGEGQRIVVKMAAEISVYQRLMARKNNISVTVDGGGIHDQPARASRLPESRERRYSKLSGISGVAADSGKALKEFYGLETVTIATERPSPRVEMPELLFETSGTRLTALVQQVSNRHRSDQPVIVGVWNSHDGQLVSAALTRENVDFRHVEGNEETAEVLWLAGTPGSVTLVPGHAVRGCDVPLHPHSPGPPGPVRGLAVLSVGRGRSARHDRALRGLAGRRSEPGDWQSFLAADDVLLRDCRANPWDH
jgi:hypothetical protein